MITNLPGVKEFSVAASVRHRACLSLCFYCDLLLAVSRDRNYIPPMLRLGQMLGHAETILFEKAANSSDHLRFCEHVRDIILRLHGRLTCEDQTNCSWQGLMDVVQGGSRSKSM